MPDTTEGEEDVQEKLDELENKVETLEEQSQGRNQLKIRAYDLTIEGSSEDTDMEDLLKMFSKEMESLTQRALIGEYQEIEDNSLHSQLFGDD